MEIGCGNGADGVLFTRNGANYTGVDLTQTAVDATRDHFGILGLEGRFWIENAEDLSYEDNAFDMVYTFGVLHHTPNPQRAADEVYRVLRPGGKAILMLYHKYSFNYYIRIMIYMRIRVLLKIFSRIGRWTRDTRNLNEQPARVLHGNEDQRIWDLHYRNFLGDGWDYLKAGNFIHHCTDGPDCPLSFTYTRRSARRLFSQFSHVNSKVAHFPIRQYLGTWVLLFVERKIASMLGWNLIVFATR